MSSRATVRDGSLLLEIDVGTISATRVGMEAVPVPLCTNNEEDLAFSWFWCFDWCFVPLPRFEWRLFIFSGYFVYEGVESSLERRIFSGMRSTVVVGVIGIELNSLGPFIPCVATSPIRHYL
jgi:hypothetical protein